MTRTQWTLTSLILGLALRAAPARADVWDVQSQNDNTSVSTRNELVPGSNQFHDLGALPGPAADQDWFALGQKGFASYEVVVDGTSGDIGPGLQVDRTDSTGMVVQFGASVTPGLDESRVLRFVNVFSLPVNDQLIRVMSNSCTTDCGADDVYSIRFHETTVRVSRFNNSATQVSVIVIQNTTDLPINTYVFYWNAAGALIGQGGAVPLNPHATNVTNIAATLPGASGSITIAHDGPYGGLNVKVVSVEPATGFTFDTLGTYVPQP